MTSRGAQAALVCAGFAVGLLVGVLGAFMQAARTVIASVVIPWGTVLMLIVLVVVVRGAVEIAWSRWAGWAAFAGWIIATVVFASEMPWGALVISAGGRQMVYLLGGVILGSAAATVPPLDRLRQARR